MSVSTTIDWDQANETWAEYRARVKQEEQGRRDAELVAQWEAVEQASINGFRYIAGVVECEDCGAVVRMDGRLTHVDWHLRLVEQVGRGGYGRETYG